MATSVLEGDRQFDLVVRYTPEYRDSIEKSATSKWAIPAASGANAYIPLSELATISLDTGAAWIYHESVQRFIPVKFSVRGRDLGGTVEEAQERIAKNVKLPPGYRLVWAGEFGDLQEAKKRLEIIVPISFILIAGALYSLFNNFRDSILALAGIPDAIVGGILALYISGLNFSISAAIGFVSLFGVSVMDGILMITFYNQERSHGLAPVDAMYRAATTRMRPLLMTALSACIGLFPAAISTGIGSQVQRPLATVIVGGMLVGPVMLLLAVPALRLIFLGGDTQHRRSRGEDDRFMVVMLACALWRAGAVIRQQRLRGRDRARAAALQQGLSSPGRGGPAQPPKQLPKRRRTLPRRATNPRPASADLLTARERDSEPHCRNAGRFDRRLPSELLHRAQQCAPSQSQSGRHWRIREPESQEYRRHRRETGASAALTNGFLMTLIRQSRILAASRSQPLCCSARAAWWGRTLRSLHAPPVPGYTPTAASGHQQHSQRLRRGGAKLSLPDAIFRETGGPCFTPSRSTI